MRWFFNQNQMPFILIIFIHFKQVVNQEDETCFKVQIIIQNAAFLEPHWGSLVQIPL
jgi:hypothetical protein